MALFSKSIEQAQAAITKAESVVAEWENKASAARAEAVRLDSEAGAAILADESAAERITLNIQAHERKAHAFDGAAAEARQKLRAVQREALEIEAREEDKQAAAARKEATSHAAKVAALLKELEQLDDCTWERAPIRDHITGANAGQTLGKAGVLDFNAHRHDTRAAVIRYFIATGKIPYDFYLLDNELGTKLNTLGSFNQGDYIPQSVYASRDAGLSFQEAAA